MDTHVEPKLEEPWKAILQEAIGKAYSYESWLVPWRENKKKRGAKRKKIKIYEALLSVPLLQWCARRGLQIEEIDPFDAAMIAKAGDLDMLKYLHENGCLGSETCRRPWDSETWGGAEMEGHCWAAAAGGHLNVLKWLRQEGCPWDESTFYYAAIEGHLDILKYAHENGCPWNEKTCSFAAWGGHLEVLKYARAHGCPWDKAYCLTNERPPIYAYSKQKPSKEDRKAVMDWIESQPA